MLPLDKLTIDTIATVKYLLITLYFLQCHIQHEWRL